MNILFINTLFDGGGAENISRNLYLGMRKKFRHETSFVCGFNVHKVADKNVYVIYKRFIPRIINYVLTKAHAFNSLSILYTRFYLMIFLKRKKIDLIHLHNVHGNYIGIRDISFLLKKYPVVWTLHDFWVGTGHCVSPAAVGEGVGCDKWLSECVGCSYLDEYTPVKGVKKVEGLQREKNKVFLNKGVYFVAPTEYVKEEFQKGKFYSQHISVVYNSVNINALRRLDKRKEKKRFGIEGKKTIAFISAHLGDPGKGLSVFLDAIPFLEGKEEYAVVLAGGGITELPELMSSGIRYVNFGYIDGKDMLSSFYSCADILVNASYSESFGLTSIEAMACGTPVVAFQKGALPEVIGTEGGWIVEKPIAKELAAKINSIFEDSNMLHEKQMNCRQYVEKKFSMACMLNGYNEIYKECVSAFYQRR